MRGRWEPEFRLRGGQTLADATHGAEILLGGNAGIQYALSMNRPFYPALYMELGAYVLLGSSLSYYGWWAMGLGLHF